MLYLVERMTNICIEQGHGIYSTLNLQSNVITDLVKDDSLLKIKCFRSPARLSQASKVGVCFQYLKKYQHTFSFYHYNKNTLNNADLKRTSHNLKISFDLRP